MYYIIMRKKYLLLSLFALILSVVSCQKVDRNPLMYDFKTPFETPPYSQIKNEHFFPAFVHYIDKAKKEIDKIATNKENPTFENTIEALEFSSEGLKRVSNIFFNMTASNTNDTLQNIEIKITPILTNYYNYISLNEPLFKRVKSVYDNAANLNLSPIQLRLTEKTYKSFSRKGAALSKEDKQKYGEITKELSNLSVKFDQNSLAATNAFVLQITDSTEMEGIPSFAVDMAKAEANKRKINGWAFTLQAPSYGAFMTYSANRELKKKFWMASNTKCMSGEFDNTENIRKISNLRLQLANLLGYPTYSAYVLEENMAKTPDKVTSFLNKLLEKSHPFASKDIANIQEYAKKQGAEFEIMPWDLGYFSQKLKNEKYSINDELLKPYFKLENVEKGVFTLATKLFGLKFIKNNEIDKYHKDINVYEVYDESDKFLAILYTDYFPRDSKGGGAWMNSIREQKIVNGIETRPIITVNCNFTPPTENAPSLLTFYELTTLLHEFGHALHGIFSTGHYSSLAGTNVARDFVELPSQIMENWASEKEFLALFANHYLTGEPISDDVVKRIVESNNFQAGYSNIRQLSFGLNDMGWHTITSEITEDVVLFEKNAIAPTQILPYIENTAMSPSFGHIFSGGYASGYYSYKWAEVLEADAFMAFKENGVFDSETAKSFRDNILSKGSSEDPMTLYINFRGHEPREESLFKKLGI